jgi:hypothetical protein
MSNSMPRTFIDVRITGYVRMETTTYPAFVKLEVTSGHRAPQ